MRGFPVECCIIRSHTRKPEILDVIDKQTTLILCNACFSHPFSDRIGIHVLLDPLVWFVILNPPHLSWAAHTPRILDCCGEGARRAEKDSQSRFIL
jgi:hypothetical protein